MFNQSKRAVLPFLAMVVTLLGSTSVSFASSTDDAELEQRIMSIVGPQTEERPPVFSMSKALMELRAFRSGAQTQTVKCADVQKTVFASKYVLTADADGKPCRIYDLSFPNFKALMGSQKVMEVPVQKMISRDYLNWMDGNFNAIDADTQTYRQNFNAKVAAKTSWIAKLRFKRRPLAVPGSISGFTDVGLPASFKASDLDFGNGFQFDAETKTQIQNLIAELGNSDPLASEYLMKVMVRPETFLDSVQFNWNDLKKVYEVILQGEFMPFKPVALVEYQAQYKYAIEKQFRGILSAGLTQLARLIPVPMVAGAVSVLVEDSFEQLDMAYEYQMLQLEDTLRAENPAFATRAMNVLYGQNANLLSAYIMAMAQGKTFDWNGLEKLGNAERYAVDKHRDVFMSKMNSKLVLEKNCQVQFLHNYFAICSKDGAPQSVYSLISEVKFYSKSFGAPMIYKYARPYETTMKRGITWVLSIGLRIVGPGIAPSLVPKLNGLLKDYMYSGILDEALLRNNLSVKTPSDEMVKWLYIQNLNVFLPKTAAFETRMIEANKKLIGVGL